MDRLPCLFNDDITEPEEVEPDEPKEVKGKAELTKAQISIHNARINLFIKEERNLRSATVVIYNVTWGQCSTMMQNQLKSLSAYHTDRDIFTMVKSSNCDISKN